MVVIREDLATIEERFGKKSLDLWRKFSGIIGFSVEMAEEIKIELNPDRPDLFSFETLNGAARVYYGLEKAKRLSMPEDDLIVEVYPQVRKIRKYFFTFVATGSAIGSHLRPLIDYQERLHDSIGKDRKKVSIGIHDLAKLDPPITYRPAGRNDVEFTTYDGMSGTAGKILKTHPKGIQYADLITTSEVPVIFDSAGDVLSLPPVINGMKSAITESSSKFFVDLTGWDVRALRSSFYLLANFLSECDYEIRVPRHPGSVDLDIEKITNHEGRNISLSSRTIRELLGVNVPLDSAKDLLERMGFGVDITGRSLKCSVPGRRDDVMGAADIAEDLAKALGYGSFPEVPLPISTIGTESRDNLLITRVRELLIGSGFQEIMTYFVTSKNIYDQFAGEQNYTIVNPKSQDFSILRNVLYPNLLHFLGVNRNRSTPQRIFEVGHVLDGPEEKIKVCMMILDSRSNYSMIKQSLDAFLTRALGGDRTRVVESDQIPFIDGRGGLVQFENRTIGKIGELHPKYLEQFSLKLPVSFAELDLNGLFPRY